MIALNYLGLIMLVLPLVLAYALGRHDGPKAACVMLALMAIAAAYLGTAGALVAM